MKSIFNEEDQSEAAQDTLVLTTPYLWQRKDGLLLITRPKLSTSEETFTLMITKPYNASRCLPFKMSFKEMIKVPTREGLPSRYWAATSIMDQFMHRLHLTKKRAFGGELRLVGRKETFGLVKEHLAGPTWICRDVEGDRDKENQQHPIQWAVGRTDKSFTPEPSAPARYIIFAAYRAAMVPPETPPSPVNDAFTPMSIFCEKLFRLSAASDMEVYAAMRANGAWLFYRGNGSEFWFPTPFYVLAELLKKAMDDLRAKRNDTWKDWVEVIAALPLKPLLAPHMKALGLSASLQRDICIGIPLAIQITTFMLNGNPCLERTRVQITANYVPGITCLPHALQYEEDPDSQWSTSFMNAEEYYTPDVNVTVCPLGVLWILTRSLMEEEFLVKQSAPRPYEAFQAECHEWMARHVPLAIQTSWQCPVDVDESDYLRAGAEALLRFNKARLAAPASEAVPTDPARYGYSGFELLRPSHTGTHIWTESDLGYGALVPTALRGFGVALPDRDAYEFNYERFFEPADPERPQHMARRLRFLFEPEDPWRRTTPEAVYLGYLPVLGLPTSIQERVVVLLTLLCRWPVDGFQTHLVGLETSVKDQKAIWSEVVPMGRIVERGEGSAFFDGSITMRTATLMMT